MPAASAPLVSAASRAAGAPRPSARSRGRARVAARAASSTPDAETTTFAASPARARSRAALEPASDPPPSPRLGVSRRASLLSAALSVAFAAPLSSRAADPSDPDDLDEDAAQALIEASMRDVLAANSGEQTYPRQTAFGEASSPAPLEASFEVSSLWDVSLPTTALGANAKATSVANWREIVDPVNGKVVQDVTVFVTPNYATANIDDLGKPENVSVAKALGLDTYDDSYRRADMLGSAKRVAKDGQVYYDWELVASPPPRSCPSAVGCLYPDHIYLMSATVRGGDLYVMSLDAFPENWRLAGNSLRRIRGTFEVRTRRDDPQGGSDAGAGEDAN